MFFFCTNLQTVKFPDTPTNALNSMRQIFQQCTNLISVDLSKFDLSHVIDMDLMLFECFNLQNIDFGNSPTSSLKQLMQTFQSCTNLESIDLSNFDTSHVTTMYLMFNNCNKIKYLNLSNFKTDQIATVNNMFSGSSSLIYLDLYSFVLTDTMDIGDIFTGLPPNVIICIHDDDTKSLLSSTNKMFFCSDECATITNFKIDTINKKCVESCSDTINSLYEYNNQCYHICPTGTVVIDYLCVNKDCSIYPENPIQCEDGEPLGFYLDSINGIYIKCYETCKLCEDSGNTLNHNCRECKSGFRFINDFDNDKNCYEQCDHYYYLDGANNYHCTLEEACPSPYNILIAQKGKCIEQCSNDNIYKYNYLNGCSEILINETTYIENYIEETTYKENIIEKTYIEDNIISQTNNNDNNINIRSSINNNGKDVISTLIKNSSVDMGKYQCFYDNPLINKCIFVDITNNDNIYDLLKSDLLFKYSIEDDKSFIVEGEDDTIYQITNSKKELDLLKSNNISDDYNLSIIDFSECEALLKKKYNINENDSLIFIKKENKTNKASQKNIEYECFEPYNKTKLNMSICSNVDINIYVKLELSEVTKTLSEQIKALGYNMFDINDRFYKDLCTPYKTLVNTDIILSDRIDYIFNNEDTQCQPNCEFMNYFMGSKYINCKCNVDNDDVVDIERIDKFEKKTLYQMFYYVLKYSNYEVLKCYKLVFVKNVLTKNWGSIIIFILFILYLICLIIYIIKGITHLRDCTEDIVAENEKININKINLFFPPMKKKKSSLKERGKKNKNSIMFINVTEKEHQKDDLKKFKNKNSSKSLTIFEEAKKNNSKLKLRKKDSNKSSKILEKEHKRKDSNGPLFTKQNENLKSSSKTFNNSTEIFSSKKDKKVKRSKFKNNDNQNELQLEGKKLEKNERKLDDFELNDLSYQEAVELDQRNIFRIYLSLLKREHRIIFTFFVYRDYNLIPIKFSRFIFLLATDIAMNVFFFNDVTMHKTFLNYGKYNFFQQIPQIIYSTIVSQIIEVFLCFLSLTDKHIYQIKSMEIDSKNRNVILEVLKCIKKKLVIYFIFTFILFCFYWYAVAAFCAVYTNTQIIFIKDSFMSALMSSVYQFILYAFPSALRVCALKCKNNNCLYKLSDLIPFF